MDNFPCTKNAEEADVLEQYRIAKSTPGAASTRLFNRRYNIETPQSLRRPPWGGEPREPRERDSSQKSLSNSIRDAYRYVPVPRGPAEFGKVLRPYRKHLHKETPKGIWFNTRFGVKRLRANRYGMYIKASKKNFYLHKW